ncbi:MAG: hypothetical protein ACLFTT_18190 [Candidatus Hydrogenedentota bacterium]
MSEEEKLEQEAIAVTSSEDVPAVYFNGFINSLSNGDVMIILKRNNRPVAVLNASYTVAKSLAQKLSQTIAYLEDATGNPIMTTDTVRSDLEKGAQSDDA